MKVKEIIISALSLLGLDEVKRELESDDELTENASRTLETLLYCYNAVENEVARGYFPLKFREKLASDDGIYFFGDFTKNPIKISGVFVNGNKAEFKLFPTYMGVKSNEIEVEYYYTPSKKVLDGDCEVNQPFVGERLLALGVASEYCVINGELEYAELFESKYRGEIDKAQPDTEVNGLYVPPRRWI